MLASPAQALPPAQRLEQAAAALRTGRLSDGWALYESRWEVPEFPGNRLPFPIPRARSRDDLVGRRVLLWAEQGPADTIQTLRFVPLVARLARSVVLAVDPALKRLADCLPGVEVIADGDAFEAADCHVPLPSLPFLLRIRLATIPNAVPYLLPPPHRDGRWRDSLGRSSRLRVGLSLTANAPSLEALAPLLELPGFEFHSLNGTPASLSTLQDHADALTDLAEVAALARQMTLVIASDGPVAHLAGALGLPVWVALPEPAHWVWMSGRANSPWYPTARLFRQANPGDWSAVAAHLHDALWQRRPMIIL